MADLSERHYNGLASKVAVLESELHNIREDVRELIAGDIKEIKRDVRELRTEYTEGQRGMSRPEKIALMGAGSAVVAAIVGAIALLAGNV